MKRRKFGFVAGSGLAAAATNAIAGSASAQGGAPDPALLKTTLTPFGGERAGNADGSIPAWTGGVTSAPVPPTTPVDVPMFQNERPLYTVDASNMAQYQRMLTPGTQALIRKWGLSLNVYQSHRTAAAPQYVYDNTAANVTRAKLNPNGGRLGFTGGYGGPPFPILDSSDPFAAGAQVIWNHLLGWNRYSYWSDFTPGYVVSGGVRVLAFGGKVRQIYPYYDPHGSPETFDGYFSKLHEYSVAPPASNGQEALVWVSTNVLVKPDMTWALVNGQGRVRKAPDEAYDTPSPSSNGIANYDDPNCFAGSPQKYDWKLLGKQEMLTPYNNNMLHYQDADALIGPHFLNPQHVRWERHRMWVVEATLHPGERNTTARRRLYVDEDTWYALMADCYDSQDKMIKTIVNYNRSVPALPGTIGQGYAIWNLQGDDYSYTGGIMQPPYGHNEYMAPQSPSFFDPEQMAASASF